MPFSSEGSNTNKASPPSLYLIGGVGEGGGKKRNRDIPQANMQRYNFSIFVDVFVDVSL